MRGNPAVFPTATDIPHLRLSLCRVLSMAYLPHLVMGQEVVYPDRYPVVIGLCHGVHDCLNPSISVSAKMTGMRANMTCMKNTGHMCKYALLALVALYRDVSIYRMPCCMLVPFAFHRTERHTRTYMYVVQVSHDIFNAR